MFHECHGIHTFIKVRFKLKLGIKLVTSIVFSFITKFKECWVTILKHCQFLYWEKTDRNSDRNRQKCMLVFYNLICKDSIWFITVKYAMTGNIILTKTENERTLLNSSRCYGGRSNHDTCWYMKRFTKYYFIYLLVITFHYQLITRLRWLGKLFAQVLKQLTQAGMICFVKTGLSKSIGRLYFIISWLENQRKLSDSHE